MFLIDALNRTCERDAESPAWTFLDQQGQPTTEWSFGHLARATRALAQRLSGARAAVLLFDSGGEFGVAFLACQAAGISAIPLPPPRETAAHSQFLASVLEETGADLILSCGEAMARLRRCQNDFDPQDLITLIDCNQPDDGPLTDQSQDHTAPALLYTSGSTSAPKGVILSETNFLHNARYCSAAWEMDQNSRVISWMPNHHSFGLIFNVIVPIYTGCRLIAMAPGTFVNHPELWLKAIHQYRGTHTAAATFGYRLCCDTVDLNQVGDLDLSCLRDSLASAEPIPREVYTGFQEKFGHTGLSPKCFTALYGLSESGPITSMPVDQLPRFHRNPDNPEAMDLAFVGAALPETTLIVVDPATGEPLAEGETGEIWVSGASVTSGYHLGKSAASFIEKDGAIWFKTGDLGLSQNGEIVITGRLKEMLIVHGRNIYPADVEWHARQAEPGILAAAAFAGKDGDGIAIVVETAYEEDQAEQAARRILAGIRDGLDLTAEEVVLIKPGSISRTSSGKIRRGPTRDTLLSGELTVITRLGTGVPIQIDQTNDSTLDLVIELFAVTAGLDVDEIDEEEPFSAYHLTSMTYLKLAKALEERLNKTIHPSIFFKAGSLMQLAEMLDDHA